MQLNTGALEGGYLTEGPDVIGAASRGLALGDQLQKTIDSQEEAKQRRQVTTSLPSLMARIKENQSDYDAVAQVAKFAPGMIDYINAANKQESEVAEKRKAELVDNLAGAYSFISTADSRNMSKEQAWQDVMQWNKAHGIDMGSLADEPYSDAAMARMKGLIYGAKALSSGDASKYSKTLQVARDAAGNLVYVQPSETGGAQVIEGLTPAETLMSVGTGGGTQLVGSKTGKTERIIEKGLSAAEAAELDPEAQARVERAKAVAREQGKAEAEKGTEISEKVLKAQDAIDELGRMKTALAKLPSPARLKLEAGKAWIGFEDKDIQSALGEVNRISGRMLEYVNRLPGAATDKDRDVFMASAGVVNNENSSPTQRIAAANSAIESYQRLLNRYGKPSSGSASAPKPGMVKNGYRYKGGNPADPKSWEKL